MPTLQSDVRSPPAPATEQHQFARGGGATRGQSRSSAAAPPAAAGGRAALPSGGLPLDESTRRTMQGRFATDFSRVRVHSGREAERAARSRDADAFTFGDHVVFGAGRYAPETTAGRSLIAHELTHVVQQRRGEGGAKTSIDLEREAEAAGRGSGPVEVSGAAPQAIMLKPRSRDDEDDDGADERHDRRRTDKRRSVEREQDRARAGKADTQVLQHEDERKLRSLERQYSDPGATRRGMARKQRDLKSAWQAAAGTGTRVPRLDAEEHIVDDERQPGAQLAAAVRIGRMNEMMFERPGVPAQQRYAAGGFTEAQGLELPIDKGGYTAPDIEPHGAAVNLKAHQYRDQDIDLKKGSLDEYTTGGVRGIAKDWLKQALANRHHLEAGKPIEIRSTLRPPAGLEKEMLAVVFYPGSPITAVSFGTTNYKLADYVADPAHAATMAEAQASAAKVFVTKPEKTAEQRAKAAAAKKADKAKAKAKAAAKKVKAAAAKTKPKAKATMKPEAESETEITTATKTKRAPRAKKPAAKREATTAAEALTSVAEKPPKQKARAKPKAQSTPAKQHPVVPPAQQHPAVPPAQPHPVAPPADQHVPPPLETPSGGKVTPPVPRPKVTPPGQPPAAHPTQPAAAHPAPVTHAPEMPKLQKPPAAKPKPPAAKPKPPAAQQKPPAVTPQGHTQDEGGEHGGHGPKVDSHRTATGGTEFDNRTAGVGADVGAGTKVTTRGVTLGPEVGAGGHWSVNVVALPDDPDAVAITTTVDMNASASLSVSGGEHVGVGVSGGVSASQRFSHTRHFKGADAKKYLDAMRNGGAGGSLPEHVLIRTGVTQGWAEAAKLYASWGGKAQADLEKGESTEATTAINAHGGANVEATAGILSVSANYGKSQTNEVTVSVANQDGENYDMAVTVNKVDGETAGGGVSVAKVGGSVGFETHVSAGQSYHFHIPIGDHDARSAVERAKSVADLAALAARYPGYFHGTSKLSGTGKGSHVDVSLLGLDATMGGTGAVSQQVDYDPEGKKTGSQITASNETGGSLGIGKFRYGDKAKEEFKASVQEHGTATGGQLAMGESHHEKTTTSSIPFFKKDETTAERNLYYSNAAFDRVVGEAHNEHDWWQHVNRGTHLADEWAALGRRLRAASHWVTDERGGGHWEYDATEVEAAMGAFTGGDTSSRLSRIDAIIHGTTGGGDLGTEGTFPGAAAGYEADFKQFVVVDPVANSKTLRDLDNAQVSAVKAGDGDRAALVELAQHGIEEMTEVRKHLDALHEGLKQHESEFDQAAVYAQMMAKLGKRRTAVGNELAALRDVITPHTKVTAAAQEDGGEGKADGTPAPESKPDPETEKADRERAESTAKGNVEQMWAFNKAVWVSLGKAEALINENDLTSNVGAINTALNDTKAAIAQWRELRKANLAAIQRYGINATFDGPDPEDPHIAPRYRQLSKAASRDS